jgi:DNA-binding transcriptional ArsR family regulator
VNDRAEEVNQLNRVIHEPTRLAILSILASVEEADFLYLMREGGFTQGNLSAHLAKLEEAGYIKIVKTFKGKYPMTICKLTTKGKLEFNGYAKRMIGILQPQKLARKR